MKYLWIRVNVVVLIIFKSHQGTVVVLETRSSSDSALHASVQASAASDSTLTGSSSMLMNRQGKIPCRITFQIIMYACGHIGVNPDDFGMEVMGSPRNIIISYKTVLFRLAWVESASE